MVSPVFRAPLLGADSFLALSGGLRFAPTTGYYLSAFQAEDYYTCWFSTMGQKEVALLERCLISFIAYFDVLREMKGETKESEFLKMLGKNYLPRREGYAAVEGTTHRTRSCRYRGWIRSTKLQIAIF